MTKRAASGRPHRPCRLFVVDLDGTLLDHKGQAHPHDAHALRTLREQGVAVAFATGRLHGGVVGAAAAVGLQGPVACADGSHIVDVQTGADLVHHAVEAKALGRLRRALGRHAVTSYVLARDRVIHDQHGAPYLGYVRVWSERFHHHPGPLAEHPAWEGEVTGLVGVGPEAAVRRMHTEAEEEGEGHVQGASFPVSLPIDFPGGERPWSLVLRASGPNKGTAVSWLAGHHGCSVDEVAVVGDWHNDVPMFRVAGRSFAMGQAPEAVKAEATDHLEATSHTGGGIAEAARRLGLLR